ncbi:MAG: YybH family protein [Bryobacteraceae bacterium]
MRRAFRTAPIAALAAIFFLGAAGPAAAQKNKKQKDDKPLQEGTVPIPMSDDNAVDLVVSTMLGAWQIGDVNRLHDTCADDILVVSGADEPPISGWPNYLRAYQAQRARTSGPTLNRINTYIKVIGNAAWATYQWQFAAAVDGSPTTAVGHTTLVLEKRNGKWLIVLNHTSLVQQGPVAPAAKPGL